MKLVSTEEMRRLEQAANDAGWSYDTMMDRAGHACALAIQQKLQQKQGRVLVLVGPGNNGGDGLVAARYLCQWGARVKVYIWKRAIEDDAPLLAVQPLGVPLVWAQNDPAGNQLAALVQEADFIVDALLGTGATGSLRGSLADLVRRVTQLLDSRRAALPAGDGSPLRSLRSWQIPPQQPYPLLVAMDVPSGLDCNTGAIDERAFRADITVTFAYPKRGLFLFPGADHVGNLLVADIGISPALAESLMVEVATAEEIGAALPARPMNSHKGTYGRALIVSGSVNFVGAPCLCTEAACRAGAGLVTLAMPQSIYRIVTAKLTEATFFPLADDMGALVPRALQVLSDHTPDYQAMLVGPGLGRETVTAEFLCALLSGRPPSRQVLGFRGQDNGAAPDAPSQQRLPPLVVDADGLYLLPTCERWWEYLPPSSVLTPHPGEMAHLCGTDIQSVQADRIGVAAEAAVRWGCTIVLKGAYTVVASAEGQVTVIPFANPALATAGTGDVLAGAIVGLMAQGLTGYEAARVGAYVHGLAGELASQDIGRAGVLASDLLPRLPLAIAALNKRPGPHP
jgi:hydroxyethylthiazole kinase-like uncharacterized protein yjeF